MCGGEERLKETGDDQHGNSSGEQADGFAAGEGEGVAAAEHSREEKTGSEAQASATGDEDAGQFERAMGGDEAPNTERHVVLRAGSGDDTHVDAIGEHEIDRSKTGEDASRECVEADGDIVGHDEAGSLRFGGEDRVGPHLVVLDLIDHLRTKHGMHELRARDG